MYDSMYYKVYWRKVMSGLTYCLLHPESKKKILLLTLPKLFIHVPCLCIGCGYYACKCGQGAGT